MSSKPMDRTSEIRLTVDDYTIAWICVLPIEIRAAREMFDETHERPHMIKAHGDSNDYFFGKIGEHNVVITWPSDTGKALAATTAAFLVATFPKIRFGLLLGIAGAAPRTPHLAEEPFSNRMNILLGDVVVSRPNGDGGGVFQFDKGSYIAGKLQPRSHLNKPPQLLLNASKGLEIEHQDPNCKMHGYLRDVTDKCKSWGSPGRETDALFNAEYSHVGGEDCSKCDISQAEFRPPRKWPFVHYGLIASSDTVVRDAKLRNELRDDYNILCCETEAAGLMNFDNLKCLVIRGISDYADSHKNDLWQPYAAITASAYAKDLLRRIDPQDVRREQPWAQIFPKLDIIQKNISKMQTTIDNEQWKNFLDFLSPTIDQDKLEEKLQSTKIGSAAQWLLDSEEFQRWSEGVQWQLRCYGERGTGKTFLCAIIAKHLREEHKRKRLNRPVICLFLEDKERAAQTSQLHLGCMLRQLIQRSLHDGLPEEIEKAYDDYCRVGSLSLDRMKEIFRSLLKKFDRVYAIVDGMDECSQDFQEFVEEDLEKVMKDDNVSLLTTSIGYEETAATVQCDTCGKNDLLVYFRCQPENVHEFDLCWDCERKGIKCPQNHDVKEPYNIVQLEIVARLESIQEYVRFWIEHDPQMLKKRHENLVLAKNRFSNGLAEELHVNKSLKEKIISVISDKAQGKFYLARVWMDALVAANDSATRSEILDIYPLNELNIFYQKSIQNLIKHTTKRNRELGFSTLGLMMAARKPLTLTSLKHALALANRKTIEEGNLPDTTAILKATKGLVTIDKGDKSSSFARFVHDTLRVFLAQEFLEEYKDVQKNNAQWITNPHSIMATVCLSYLNSSQFAGHRAEIENFPFLSYTLEFWGDHVRMSEFDHKVQNEAFDFLNDSKCLAAYIQAAEDLRTENYARWRWIHEGIDALHVCAWFGLSKLITKLVDDGGDVNIHESRYGQTHLMYASRKGHLAAVRELLNLRARIIDTNKIGETALIGSIWGIDSMERLPAEVQEQAEVFYLLMKRCATDVNAIIDKRRNRTALMLAAEVGQEAIIGKLLREESIDVNMQDSNGYTALSIALSTQSFSLEIAKALLERPGSNPNLTNRAGRCALIIAIKYVQKPKECHGIVELLLKHGADPNLKDCAGNNALAWAVVIEGKLEILKALLKCPRTEPESMRGLVHFASEFGCPETIRLLHEYMVEKEKVSDLDVAYEYGFTALHRVTLSERDDAAEVTATLLYLGADPNAKDDRGITAYDLACQLQRTHIMDALKGANKSVQSASPTGLNTLPTLVLAKTGHWDLVEEAIRIRNPDLKEKEGRTGNTLLHFAVRSKRLDILRKLLADDGIQRNQGNHDKHVKRTPLHLAAGMGNDNIEIARLLVEHRLEIDAVDLEGSTPLSLAMRNSNIQVAICLVEAGADVRGKPLEIQQLFFAAVKQGSFNAVKILHRHGANLFEKNDNGKTARQLAENAGDMKMLKALDSLENGWDYDAISYLSGHLDKLFYSLIMCVLAYWLYKLVYYGI